MLRNLGMDVRYAFRRLRTTPVFTLFAIITLALGIGATTAIYSAVHALVLRPLHIRNVEEVVNIYHKKPPGSGPMMWMSWPDYQDLTKQQTQFSHLAAWTRFRQAVALGDHAEFVMGEMVGGDYFPLVGVLPELGRLLQPADDLPGASPVVVISHTAWQRWFGGNPSVVGRKIFIAGEVFEIVGVVEPEFRGVDMPNISPTPMWMPLSTALRLDPSQSRRLLDRESRQFSVKARMKTGSSLADARREIALIAGRLDAAAPIGQDQQDPRYRTPWTIARPWFVMPAADRLVDEQSDVVAIPLFSALMGAVGLVLLVTCTNLANLTLARASRRRHEIAVRLAIGASRWRLIREQLVEGFLVASAGGVLGLLVARGLMVLLSGPVNVAPGLVVQIAPVFNTSVILAAVAAAVLTVIVFSLLPAIRITRVTLGAALQADGTTTSLRWRWRRSLISAQVMVSAILITLALLCVQQIHSFANQDLGVDLDRMALAQVDFRVSRYDEPRARAAMDAALQDIRKKVGVERVALVSSIPLGRRGTNVSLAGPDRNGFGSVITGTQEMFSVFGLDLRRGRLFDSRDVKGSSPVMVISEITAMQMFDSTDVVGRQLQVTRQRSVLDSQPPVQEAVSIIGIVSDPNNRALGRRDNGYVFRPWDQYYDPSVALAVRAFGDPAALVEVLRRTMQDVAPAAAVFEAGTGVVLAGADNLTPRIVGSIAGLLGVFALILSVAGLYGVLSHIVSGRTREVGIRIALGADRPRIMRMIMREGLHPVLSGLVAGLAIGSGVRMLLRGILAQFFPVLDPLVLAIVPLPFVAAALVACYLPARRAARVDPMVALRQL